MVLSLVWIAPFNAAIADDETTAGPKPDQWTLIHAGSVIAEPGKPLQEKQTIVVRNDRIEAIVAGFVDEFDGAETPQFVDLTDAYVLPGLIDAHVHLDTGDRNKGRSDERGKDIFGMLNVVENADKTLRAGYTTVRNVGGYGWSVLTFRDGVKERLFPGPRVLAAAHTVEIGTFDEDGPGACFDVASCKEAVRSQIEMGADWIKIYATCSGSKPCGREFAPGVFTQDELAAIIEAANTREIPVAAHAHGTAGINDALRAGVRTIEHGSYNDKNSRALFLKKGAYYVPTLAVEDNIIKDYPTASEAMKPVMENFMDQHPKRVAAAFKAGVKIAAGSDAGVIPHGQNANELIWYVKIGMTPAEALRAATVVNAEMLMMEDKIGALAPGRYADIIAVKENPLANIEALKEVEFVMAAGRTVVAPDTAAD